MRNFFLNGPSNKKIEEMKASANSPGSPTSSPSPESAGKSRRGRPRTFDKEAALEAAMFLFWERGYEGVSMDDLTEAMGISPSSLYAGFGSKEQLFLKALDKYEREIGMYWVPILENTADGREAFTRMFERASGELTHPDRPRGCMMTLALLHSSEELEPLRRKLNKRRSAALGIIKGRLRRALKEGDLPQKTPVDLLAQMFMTVFQGMTVRARAGADRRELQQAGRGAIAAWPTGTHPPG
jgi:TetR/AcrR family transcriptional regulator, copper-responsive repressor